MKAWLVAVMCAPLQMFCGCSTLIVIANRGDIAFYTELESRKLRAEMTKEMRAFRKDPLTTLRKNESRQFYAYTPVICDRSFSLSEDVLKEVVVRAHFYNPQIVSYALDRREWTESGLREIEPIIGRNIEKKYERVLIAYLSNRNIPDDILEAYANRTTVSSGRSYEGEMTERRISAFARLCLEDRRAKRACGSKDGEGIE